jgi:PAS domain-containing protein
MNERNHDTLTTIHTPSLPSIPSTSWRVGASEKVLMQTEKSANSSSTAGDIRNSPASQQLTNIAYDRAPFALVTFDEFGRILLVNKKYKELSGVSDLHRAGLDNIFSLSESSSSGTLPLLRDAVQYTKKAGEWEGDINIYCHHDGEATKRPVHTHLALSRYTNEEGLSSTVFLCTITPPPPSKDTKPTSTTHEARVVDFQGLTKTMPAGMCVWNCSGEENGHPNFRLVSINGLAEQILGVSIPVGALLRETVDLQGNPGVREFFWSVITRQETIYHPIFSLGYGQFSLTAFPLGGSFLGLMLQPCETHPSSKESLFALDQAATAFCVANRHPDGYLALQYVNFGFLNLTGYQTEELLSLPLERLLSFPSADFSLKAMTSGVVGRAAIKNKIRGSASVRITCIPMENLSANTFKYAIFFHPAASAPETNRPLSPPGQVSLYEEIFESLDTCAMIWELGEDSSRNCRLVSLNRRALQLSFIKDHLDTSKKDVLMTELFPQLAESGIFDVFVDVLRTSTPRYLGVIPFHNEGGQYHDANFVTKILPIQSASRLVLVFFEANTDTPTGTPKASTPKLWCLMINRSGKERGLNRTISFRKTGK